ncbi:LysE family translocator [Nitratireductor sp. StC3]|uniref:LysE family translocator n=1 Tax=Nitratireductor sp. StC3 TaxID=2126741 RepID=UPI001FDF7ABD|nr:LysE family translocator [Nitratireductor sp. StC3]
MMEDLPHLANALGLLWLAAFPLMGSPGPATLSLAGIGTAYGFRPGLPYLAGIVAGTTGVLLMIATGVTALILARPEFVVVLTGIAAAYIVYLAWKIATAPVGRAALDGASAPAFVPGFLLALANPKAFAAIGAVYASQTLVPGHLGADTGAKLVALALVIVIVNTAWLAFGASFSRLLRHPRIGRAANIAFALMLLASVGLALVAA